MVPLQVSIGQAVANILSNPVSILSLLMGVLIIGVSMAVFGYLSLGALAGWLTDALGTSGGRPPQQGR